MSTLDGPSSVCFIRIAPTNLRMEASLGSEAEEHAYRWKDCPPNANDIGPSLDLAVQAFDRIRAV